jgi:D-glycero-alpha-D-manno-heptose-7-phosphate kinase
MIIARTPFRVSFFGGGTDFPEFYSEYGGATLVTAIDKYCYISIHRLGSFFKHRFRASYAQTELVQKASEFRHPLIRECLLHLRVEDGLEINHISDLPGRTGLGTSSSFTVGLLHALHTFRGDRVTPSRLAHEAIDIERVRVKDAGGQQDQVVAAYGGFIRVNFSGDQKITVKKVSITKTRLSELQDNLLMFYTGGEQSAETILQKQISRSSRNGSALLEMRQMVGEAETILRGRGSLDSFGRLLDESWQRKKSLSRGISNGTINDAYQSARRAGALGGKLLGAGGRGFLLCYADKPLHAEIERRVKPLRRVHFGFSGEGSRIIFRTKE